MVVWWSGGLQHGAPTFLGYWMLHLISQPLPSELGTIRTLTHLDGSL